MLQLVGGVLTELQAIGREGDGWCPRVAAIFGASGGIGAACAAELIRRGCELIHVGSRSLDGGGGRGKRSFTFDLTDEASLAAAALTMADDPPELVLVATGALTLADGTGPEKSYRQLDAAAMAQILAVNTIGPALVAKHMLPLLRRDRRTVFAVLTARVGSISDNRLGGWHSYRASKAALNMLLRNFAIELSRTHPLAVVLGLHPGTVDTALSTPFQRGVPEDKLFTPQRSAQALLDVIAQSAPADSGSVFDWQGERVEP